MYLVSSLRNVAREMIHNQDLPQGTYEIIKWVSDAHGIAYIMVDTAAGVPVNVSKWFGKKESEGFRPSHDYLKAVPGSTQPYRIIDKKTGLPCCYILASERLEIETGFNILRKRIALSIRDPEDEHHRRLREAPR